MFFFHTNRSRKGESKNKRVVNSIHKNIFADFPPSLALSLEHVNDCEIKSSSACAIEQAGELQKKPF